MKYVLMFIETERFEKDLAAMDQAERDLAFQKVAMWFAEHADKISHHIHLQPAHTATTVRLETGSDPIVTDGPFVEGKEVVTGFVEVELTDLDEAIQLARSWPGCPIVEIRPIQG